MISPRLIIAIDGPSGAGKGTVARTVASRLSYRHVDTGAMYRAVAWLALHDGIDLRNAPAVSELARRARLTVGDLVTVNGHEVTAAIRTPEIDQAAAIVAAHAPVRAVLVERQRALGRERGIVMEGRDIGSVVFPDADVKIYLDATPDERARRRAADTAHAVSRASTGIDKVAGALAERDSSDRTRAVSPLRQPDDAVYIDTTGVAIDAVVSRVMEIVSGKLDVGQRAEGRGQREA